MEEEQPQLCCLFLGANGQVSYGATNRCGSPQVLTLITCKQFSRILDNLDAPPTTASDFFVDGIMHTRTRHTRARAHTHTHTHRQTHTRKLEGNKWGTHIDDKCSSDLSCKSTHMFLAVVPPNIGHLLASVNLLCQCSWHWAAWCPCHSNSQEFF
jgi:hypothetical protein